MRAPDNRIPRRRAVGLVTCVALGMAPYPQVVTTTGTPAGGAFERPPDRLRQAPAGAGPELVPFDGGFYRLEAPAGWRVTPAGLCTSFALMARSEQEPLLRTFYFSSLGPVYMSEEQKRIDTSHLRRGGEPIEWYDMPVVEPFAPENFVVMFERIVQTGIVTNLTALDFRLTDARVIRTRPVPDLFSRYGGETEILRVVFRRGHQLGEALLLLTLAPLLPFTGEAGEGVGYGLSFTGVSAPHGRLDDDLDLLTATLGSLWLSPSYLGECRQLPTRIFDGINRPRRFLQGFAVALRTVWEQRRPEDDVLAARTADGMVGRERLWDPATGRVYAFPLGTWARHADGGELPGLSPLRPLPEDARELWLVEPLDGERFLR